MHFNTTHFEETMTTRTQAISTSAQQPVPAFLSMLAIGAMLATLAVVAYACLHSDDAAVRVALLLKGAEAILVTWAAGILASVLNAKAIAGESAAQALRFARA